MSSASASLERHESEDDVGHRLGEDAADAEHHGRPELRRRATGRRSARGCPTPSGRPARRPRRRRAWPRRAGPAAAASTAAASREVEAHQAPLGLVRDAVAAELRHDREAELGGGRGRRRRPWPRSARPARARRARPAAPSRPPPTGCGWSGGGRRVGHGRRAYSGPSQPRFGPGRLLQLTAKPPFSGPSHRTFGDGVGSGWRLGSRAARKSWRTCSRRASSAAGVERVAAEQALEEGRVGEVAEQGAVAREQQLLGVVRPEAAVLHLVAEVAHRPHERRAQRLAQVEARVARRRRAPHGARCGRTRGSPRRSGTRP